MSLSTSARLAIAAAVSVGLAVAAVVAAGVAVMVEAVALRRAMVDFVVNNVAFHFVFFISSSASSALVQISSASLLI